MSKNGGGCFLRLCIMKTDKLWFNAERKTSAIEVNNQIVTRDTGIYKFTLYQRQAGNKHAV